MPKSLSLAMEKLQSEESPTVRKSKREETKPPPMEGGSDLRFYYLGISENQAKTLAPGNSVMKST
jgi:hypothetical protein